MFTNPNRAEPRIEYSDEIILIGTKIQMSFAVNKTFELWKKFSPRRTEISHVVHSDLFSVEIYSNPSFYEVFDPTLEFEKWGAVQVSDCANIPNGMEALIIPAGQYAVFHYKGKPSEAASTYQYIYGTWFPNSQFMIDNKPHFALMGDKYKWENPDSEEELWFPIKEK